MPTQTDYAYLAGLVDGEGHVDVRRNRIGYAAWFWIANTNVDMVLWLDRTFDVSVVGNGEASREKNHRQGYGVHFRHKVLLEICRNILPYVTAKRQQVELMIEFLEVHNANRGNVAAKRDACEDILRRFSGLNSRGFVE